jgi:hypothetical protein
MPLAAELSISIRFQDAFGHRGNEKRHHRRQQPNDPTLQKHHQLRPKLRTFKDFLKPDSATPGRKHNTHEIKLRFLRCNADNLD